MKRETQLKAFTSSILLSIYFITAKYNLLNIVSKQSVTFLVQLIVRQERFVMWSHSFSDFTMYVDVKH